MDGCFGLLEQHMGWFKVSWHASELGLFWTLLVLWAQEEKERKGTREIRILILGHHGGRPSSLQLAPGWLGPPYLKLSTWGERGGRGGFLLTASSMGDAGRLRPRGSHGRASRARRAQLRRGGWDGDEDVGGAVGGEAIKGSHLHRARERGQCDDLRFLGRAELE